MESSTKDEEEVDVADDENSEIEKSLVDSNEFDSNEVAGDEELERRQDRTGPMNLQNRMIIIMEG